jgi:DNA polymerase III subunit delta'
MFEEYEKKEPIMYKQLSNNMKNGLNHAYLFELNNNIYAYEMVMSFVKEVLSGGNKDILKRIEEGNYTELKHIYPNGQQIKKEQLDELQKSFSTMSIENDKRIYVIHDAEKLNAASANSLLKFLEEPSNGIIAILLTNNINLMFKTIVSRCQILTFSKNKIEDYIEINQIDSDITIKKLLFVVWKTNEEITDYHRKFLKNVIDFINCYEEKKIKTIVYENNFFNEINDKSDLNKFFECVILFYNDLLRYKYGCNVLYFDDYIENIKKLSYTNSKENILKKINILIEKIRFIKNNVNTSMFVDGIIIDMEG